MGVRQLTVTKPSRSDEVPDEDQQLQITNHITSYFDALAPRRPSKPNRSDPHDFTSTISTTIHHDQHISLPDQLDKLRSLQSQTVIVSGTDTMLQEEFVETQYYKHLDSIDKQHHTTGTGFIKVVPEKSENGYDLQLREANQYNYDGRRYKEFKTNPATNDWIPSLEDYEIC